MNDVAVFGAGSSNSTSTKKGLRVCRWFAIVRKREIVRKGAVQCEIETLLVMMSAQNVVGLSVKSMEACCLVLTTRDKRKPMEE